VDTIFRAPVVTAIAALNTVVANTAQPEQNRHVLLPPSPLPFGFHEWVTAPRLPDVAVWHHRPQPPSPIAPPFIESLWPRPAAPLQQLIVEPVRNRLLFPSVSLIRPFVQADWPGPRPFLPKPETFLFYYIQDQTAPAFIQYDWPKAPRLPTVETAPVRNEILFPLVIPAPPFRQKDWPPPMRRLVAKDHEPEKRNVLLPTPVGLPTHQQDWPRPHGAKSLQGSYTLNDLGLLTVPIVRPVRPLDWPNPARLPRTVFWERSGVPLTLHPRFFKPEWASESNVLLGPSASQPEPH
jgi:hypothetical protein